MRRLKWPLLAVLAAGSFGAGAVVYAQDEPDSESPQVEASIDGWRWAPRTETPPPQRERPKRRRAAEPKRQAPAPEPAPEPIPEPPPLPEPSDDDAITRAEVLPNGVALPPLEAPPQIRAIIEAGNTIARTPYKWGGGHGRWQDTGYDCSGSVSYALAAAGLLDGPLASGPLMRWGAPGEGKWLTIYASDGHVFLFVAGVRFDTSAASRGKTGSRFSNDLRSTSGYVARHWPGL